MTDELTDDLIGIARDVLRQLAEDRNVLLTGAPATGKTTLLNLIAKLFEERGETVVDPYGSAAFPVFASTGANAFPGGTVMKGVYLELRFIRELNIAILSVG